MTNTIEELGGIEPQSPISALLTRRAELMALTEKSRQAVLSPAESGGLTHALRALIAVRASERLGDEVMKDYYYGLFSACDDFYEFAGLVDPDTTPQDAWLAAVLGHADLLTRNPRSATQKHIEELRRAGLEEADIVRLAELAAFLGYQARLVAGLRLMEASR